MKKTGELFTIREENEAKMKREEFIMPDISVNGITMHYKEEGAGEPLILLHGLTASSATFQQEIAYLKKHFHVFAPDARGHGQSSKPEHYFLEDHIQDMIAFMDAMNIEKAHVMGVSMGSYIAQGSAIQHPSRIGKLILVVPKAHGKTSSMARLFSEHADELEGLNPEAKMNRAAKYMFHNLRAVGLWMKNTLKNSTILTPEQQGASNKALEHFDFRLQLPGIKSKTFVISGTHDGLNPPKYGKEIAGLIPGAAYTEFEQSGHAPNVEEAERFEKAIMAFLVNE